MRRLGGKPVPCFDEPGTLTDQVLETAPTICDNAPFRAAGEEVDPQSAADGPEARTDFEIEAYNHLVDTEDPRKGVLAFNEKRKLVFNGR